MNVRNSIAKTWTLAKEKPVEFTAAALIAGGFATAAVAAPVTILEGNRANGFADEASDRMNLFSEGFGHMLSGKSADYTKLGTFDETPSVTELIQKSEDASEAAFTSGITAIGACGAMVVGIAGLWIKDEL